VLEVVEPGLQATLQDRGRSGHAHLGVPQSGGCDPWSLEVADSLHGDPSTAAVLEVTLGGAELLVLETCTVAIAGAELGASADGRPIAPGEVHLLQEGDALRFAGGTRGARVYLSLAGGIRSTSVLGSASTYAPAALGGIDGRAVRIRDRLEPVRRGDLTAAGRRWPTAIAPMPDLDGPIAIVVGPDVKRVPVGSLEALTSTRWTASSDSDRMGVRLRGVPLEPAPEIVSQPTLPGAIQVPRGGEPIVLLADAQTVGGYPVVAVVVRADLPRLGQLRPGDTVSLEVVTAEEARHRWIEQRAALDRAAAELRRDATWDRLADQAGA
jgi:antagonist of KipI